MRVGRALQLLAAAALGALVQRLVGEQVFFPRAVHSTLRPSQAGNDGAAANRQRGFETNTPVLPAKARGEDGERAPAEASPSSLPILHVLKLQSRPGDLFPGIEFGAVPGYLYSGKMPHNVPIRYLLPRKHSNIPSAEEAASAGMRHLFVFDARPPSIRAAHQAVWGAGSLKQPLDKAQLQRAYWAQPGHSIGIGVFRDEQGQIPYTLLDRAPWGYIFRTFWHNSLPGTERPNVPLGTMACRGAAHVKWAEAVVQRLAILRQAFRAAKPEHAVKPEHGAGPQEELQLQLVQNGGGGGYAPGKGGPKGGWWPDRPKPAADAVRKPGKPRGGRQQRWGGVRPHVRPGRRQLWEGSIDVKADAGAAVTHVAAKDVLSAVAAARQQFREGPLYLFASKALGAVPAPNDAAAPAAAASAPVHPCLQADAVASTLPPRSACFNAPGAEARALAFLPRGLLTAAEEGVKGGVHKRDAWAAQMVRQAVAAAVRHAAGGVIPPLMPAEGGLKPGTIPAVGLMAGAQQLTADALQRAHTQTAKRLEGGVVSEEGGGGELTRQLAARSLCGYSDAMEKWGLLQAPPAAWAAVCDVTLPVWHTHVDMNWVWLGTLPGQLIPSSQRKQRCAWNGSVRAFRARTLAFFQRWNVFARRVWGGGGVECEMRDAKRFMGDWGSDENHAAFRDVVFGPNVAGNSPESIRHFDQLAAGVISVTVTAEVARRDDEMWSDGAWPCGRPPGIYAESWLDAAVQMQALWQRPAELDTLQAAGTLWLQRHQACVRRDAEQVVAAAMAPQQAAAHAV